MPAAPASLADLLIQETQEDILDAALTIAATLDLPVTSWRAGDPTRSMYVIESNVLGNTLEPLITGFIQSGFLDFAQDEWLVIRAKQDFNVDVPDATFAETDVTLTNTGGGIFVLGPGDVTVKNTATGQTYHSTTGGTLSGVGDTLDVTVVADNAGSIGSSAAGAIDALVTSLLGVTCTNAAAAVGIDQQDPATTVAQCRAKASSFSPNGPATAYEFVALTPSLTGINTVTKAKSSGDSDTGDVLLYVAGAGGSLGTSDVAAVQAAVLVTCVGLCITPTVLSATPLTVPVAYNLWVYSSVNQTVAQLIASIQIALQNAFKARPIGGDVLPPAATGTLYASLLEDAIGAVAGDALIRVQVLGGDVAMTAAQDVQLGVVTPNIQIVPGRPS